VLFVVADDGGVPFSIFCCYEAVEVVEGIVGCSVVVGFCGLVALEVVGISCLF